MHRIAKILQALPMLVLGTIVAAACDQDSTSPAGPAIEASRLKAGDLEQVDRFGLPAIATVFIPTAQKDAYNQAAPAGDEANFKDEIVAVLTAFGHPNPNGLADALTPDIQPIDLSQPTGFLNGRTLSDDVITAELGLIFGSNTALNDDHVDKNDKEFLTRFPYLAGPHVQ